MFAIDILTLGKYFHNISHQTNSVFVALSGLSRVCVSKQIRVAGRPSAAFSVRVCDDYDRFGFQRQQAVMI